MIKQKQSCVISLAQYTCIIKMSCRNKITSDFTCKTKRNRLDLPKYAGVKAALLSVEKIPEAIKHK